MFSSLHTHSNDTCEKMAFLRLVVRIMGRISTFRSYQFVVLLAAALAVVAFYYFGSEKQNFSTTTKRIKQTQVSHNTNRNDADLTVDTRLSHPAGSEEQGGEEPDLEMESKDLKSRKRDKRVDDQHFHALMMFTKVDKSRSLQDKFRVAMLSMVKHGRFHEGEVLVLHFVSDQASQELGEGMLKEFLRDATFKYEVLFHDVVALTQKLFPIVEAMQKHFSAGSGAYYSDSIFFLSVAMHHIMPQSLTRIIQLDLDLKYRTNIRDLFQEFQRFSPGVVIGIAREMQPVYSVVTISRQTAIISGTRCLTSPEPAVPVTVSRTAFREQPVSSPEQSEGTRADKIAAQNVLLTCSRFSLFLNRETLELGEKTEGKRGWKREPSSKLSSVV